MEWMRTTVSHVMTGEDQKGRERETRVTGGTRQGRQTQRSSRKKKYPNGKKLDL